MAAYLTMLANSEVEAVIGLGMIPDVPPEKVNAIPTGAGIGVATLLSDAGFALAFKAG